MTNKLTRYCVGVALGAGTLAYIGGGLIAAGYGAVGTALVVVGLLALVGAAVVAGGVRG